MKDSRETSGRGGRLKNLSEADLVVVDDLIRRLRSLIRVRAVLLDRGATRQAIAAHTDEIERLRAQLAEHVRETAA